MHRNEETMTTARQMLPLKTRFMAIVASLVCYAAACVTPALELIGKEHTHIFGGVAFLYGPLVVLTGQFSWFANLLWLTAILLVLFGRFTGGLVLSVLALAVAAHAWALFGIEIPGDEASATTYSLKSLEIGFYLWLLSFVLLAIGSFMLRRKAMQKQESAVEPAPA
jgi:cytochrome c-type biogenesis protein CcmH/NrfF